MNVFAHHRRCADPGPIPDAGSPSNDTVSRNHAVTSHLSLVSDSARNTDDRAIADLCRLSGVNSTSDNGVGEKGHMFANTHAPTMTDATVMVTISNVEQTFRPNDNTCVEEAMVTYHHVIHDDHTFGNNYTAPNPSLGGDEGRWMDNSFPLRRARS
ncbi:MAG: hypothetical protein JW384_04127 [Nitrosomonadaceae bacterium]|nr:hypothetical protein [Nitrosomonadaceae bacterium]